MAFDAHKNLAIATVATPPSPPGTGTTLVVAAGEGARFSVAPFNATVWPSAALPTPANAEIVRVTSIGVNTLTITRMQEGTAARAIAVGDLIAETITAKTLTDLETQAAIKDQFNVFTTEQEISGATFARLGLRDLSSPVDARLFRFVNVAQELGVYATTDGGAVLASPLILTRTGSVKVGTDLFEKSRTSAVGHWIDVAHNAANFTSNSGAWTVGAHTTFAYQWIGKTIWITFYAANTSITGTPTELRINVPAPGLVFNRDVGQPFNVANPAAAVSWGLAATGGNVIKLYRDVLGTAWTAGVCHVSGVFMGSMT